MSSQAQAKGKLTVMTNISVENSVIGGNTSNVYNATLKGKINGLEETCKALTEELNFYKNEISTLRDEKVLLENNLAKKT